MILANNWPMGIRPPLWDGKASQRIVDVIDYPYVRLIASECRVKRGNSIGLVVSEDTLANRRIVL